MNESILFILYIYKEFEEFRKMQSQKLNFKYYCFLNYKGYGSCLFIGFSKRI